MNVLRERLLDSARARGLVSEEQFAVARARRDEVRPFGIDVDLVDVLAASGVLPEAEVEEARRGEDLPSRIAGLEVVRLVGGTPEHPVYLARRSVDGETFLVHACMLARRDAPAEVDTFVRAMENGRRLAKGVWIPVREAVGAEGAYAAVSTIPEGMRLDERLATGGHLAPTEAIATARRVAEALWSVEALGLAAPFPDPSLVLVGRDGAVTLPAIEVLRALRPGTFDPAETARSAANFLARLVGPERLDDPAIRGLLADLSSGRFEGLRPDARREFSVPAAPAGTGGDLPTPVHTDTILLDDDEPPPRAPAWPRPAAPAPVPSGAPRRVRLVGGGLALAGLVVFLVATKRGDSPSPTEPPPSDPVASAPPAPVVAPGPVARTPGPTTADPAVEALEKAIAWRTEHREDDPRGAIERLRAVEARFGGSEAAARAAAAREQLQRDLEADATRRAEAIASDVTRFLRSEEIGAALAAVERFPKTLSATNAALRIDALRVQVKERAEAVYTSLRDALDGAGEPERRGAADAALDRIKALGDPELVLRAKRRIADAEERAGGAAARRRELAPDLDRVVGEAVVAAGAGDVDRGRRIVEAAGRGPLASPYRDRLAALGEAVGRIGALHDAVAAELRDRVGKAAALTLREYGAKPSTVTVGELVGDRLAYTKGGIAGAVRLPALDPECLVALATGSGREGDGALALAAATFLAATGRLPQAEVLRARASALGASADTFEAEARAARQVLAAASARETAAGDAIAERDRDGARAAWGRAAQTAPFDPAPHRRLGESFLAEKRPDDAYAELRRARAAGDSSPELLHAIARACANRPDDEALAAWREFLAAAPKGDPRLEAARATADALAARVTRGGSAERVRAAKALLDAGKPGDAMAALEEALAADPRNLEGWKLFARAAEKAGDPFRAFVALLSARDVAKAVRDVTDVKEQLDRLERAHGPRPAQLAVRKEAELALGKGEYAAAAEGFERAVGMSPLDTEARLGLGSALTGLGARTAAKPVFDRGVAAFDAAIRLGPDDPRGWAGRAELKRWRGDLPGAIADASAAIERRKDFVAAYNTRGLARYQALELDGALADIGVVTTMAPLLCTPRITRAAILAALGKLDEADADLAAAKERSPTDAERAQMAAIAEQIATRRRSGGR